MDYESHAIISARKFKCNISDTLHLHKLMDSSKMFYPHGWQHRLFSHNTFFIDTIVNLYFELTGKVSIENTLSGGHILIRDVLIEHLKEDFSGKIPDLKDWLKCIQFDTTESWINRPDRRELDYLKTIKNKTEMKNDN